MSKQANGYLCKKVCNSLLKKQILYLDCRG